MRRRSDQVQTPTTPVQPTTPAVGAATPAAGTDYNWTTQNNPATAAGVPAGRAKGAAEALMLTLTSRGMAGPAEEPRNNDEGDEITVTIGKEIYYPGGTQKFNGFEVGPLTASVRIRPGESAAQAWVRARSVLEHLYEAEVQVRIEEFTEHLDEARKQAAQV